MTRQEAQHQIGRHWGTALAVASAAAYYAVSAWTDRVPDEAKVTLVMSGVAGIAKWLKEQNKTDTEAAVETNVNYETLLAKLGIKQRFEDVERMQAARHVENAASLDAIKDRCLAGDELHAEHVNVTDSLEAGVVALNGAVSTLVPGFAAPPIYRRKREWPKQGAPKQDEPHSLL